MATKKDQSAKMIGLFVVGGIVLLVAGIIAFSTTKLFSQRMEFVMYFDSSLNGLEIGSPVSFRGVAIGHVTNIVMKIDNTRQEVNTPVFVEIDPDRFQVSSFMQQLSLLAEPPMKRMIDKGLRAQLQTQSFITGQMFIELEFHPSYTARMHKNNDTGVDEIPTIPSQFDQVQATIKSVLERLRDLDLDELITTAAETVRTTNAAVYEFYQIAHKVNTKLDPILDNMDAASAEGRARLVELKKTLASIDSASNKLNSTIAAASPSLTKATANGNVAFEEMATAMRALKELAEFLERNPDALLTGKQNKRR